MSIGEDHKIAELSKEDIEWINYHLRRLRAFLEDKSGEKLTELPTPEFLDRYVPSALDEVRQGKMSEEEFRGIFGAGFGQYFEEKAGFQWVLFTDKYGTDLAVRNDKTGVIGFPVSSAGKNLNDPTAGKFEAIFHSLTQ